MKNLKEFIVIFLIFCLFSVINHYSPMIYNSIQTTIFIPILVFIVYKIIMWLIRYIRIKISTTKR